MLSPFWTRHCHFPPLSYRADTQSPPLVRLRGRREREKGRRAGRVYCYGWIFIHRGVMRLYSSFWSWRGFLFYFCFCFLFFCFLIVLNVSLGLSVIRRWQLAMHASGGAFHTGLPSIRIALRRGDHYLRGSRECGLLIKRAMCCIRLCTSYTEFRREQRTIDERFCSRLS